MPTIESVHSKLTLVALHSGCGQITK